MKKKVELSPGELQTMDITLVCDTFVGAAMHIGSRSLSHWKESIEVYTRGIKKEQEEGNMCGLKHIALCFGIVAGCAGSVAFAAANAGRCNRSTGI